MKVNLNQLTIKKSDLQNRIIDLENAQKENIINIKSYEATLKESLKDKIEFARDDINKKSQKKIDEGLIDIKEENDKRNLNLEKKLDEQNDFLYQESKKRQNEIREFKEEQNQKLSEELAKEAINRQQIYDECKNECTKQIKENQEAVNRIIDSANEEQRKVLDKYTINLNQTISERIDSKVKETEINDITEKAISKILDTLNKSLTDVGERKQNSISEAIEKLYLDQINVNVVKEEIEKLGENEFFHENYNHLKYCVEHDVIPMLVGPAGTGKSHAVMQLARDLGLRFFMSNRVQNSFDLIGFVDANGKYHKTPFYEAYTKGGLFLFDEIDASRSEALVTVNTAIAQGKMPFPNQPSPIKKHKNFKMVCAANTYGIGSTEAYTARNSLDKSTIDRFIPIVWGYSKKLEDNIIDDKELLALCWAIRDAVEKNGQEIIVSTRGIEILNELVHSNNRPFKVSYLIKQKFFATLEQDDIKEIYEEVKKNIDKKNKYLKEMEELI